MLPAFETSWDMETFFDFTGLTYYNGVRQDTLEEWNA